MYRLHFDVSRGKWLLQFLKFGVLWFSVKSHDGQNDVLFDTVEQVESYITAHGIDKVYRRVANPIEREAMFYVPGNPIIGRQ